MPPHVPSSSSSSSSSLAVPAPAPPCWDAPVHKASLQGDREALSWLLTLDASLVDCPGFNGILPLHCASRRGHASLLPYVFWGVAPFSTPLILPTPLHPPTPPSYLLAHGADPQGLDRGKWSMLHHAAAGGHVTCLSFLLLTPVLAHAPFFVAMDAAAGDGSNPLLIAVMEGRSEAAR